MATKYINLKNLDLIQESLGSINFILKKVNSRKMSSVRGIDKINKIMDKCLKKRIKNLKKQNKLIKQCLGGEVDW